MSRASKFMAGGGLLLLLAGVATVVFKQNTMAQLRSEQQVLLSEGHEAGALALENQGIAKLREENVEVAKLRGENQDLPRLRNEARQLRRETEELAKLRAENERLQGAINTPRPAADPLAPPAGFVSRTALMDVGTGTPEATAQTFFWAACTGNIHRLNQLTVDATSDTEDQQTDVVKAMKGFPGFGIAGREIVSPDEVELSLQSSAGAPVLPMKFKRVGSEWKLEEH